VTPSRSRTVGCVTGGRPVAAQRKASTLFSLLLEVAGDTAGAFVLVAPGQTPEPPRYEATT